MTTLDTFMNTIKTDFIQSNNKVSNDTSKMDKSDAGFSNILDSVNKTLNFSYDKSSTATMSQKDTSSDALQYVNSNSFNNQKTSSVAKKRTENKTAKDTKTNSSSSKNISKTKDSSDDDADNKVTQKDMQNDTKVESKDVKDTKDAKDTTAKSQDNANQKDETQTDDQTQAEVPANNVPAVVADASIIKDLTNITTQASVSPTENAPTPETAPKIDNQSKNSLHKETLNLKDKNVLAEIKEHLAQDQLNTQASDVKNQVDNTATVVQQAEPTDANANKGIEFQVKSDAVVKNGTLSKNTNEMSEDLNQKVSKASEKLDKIETNDKPIVTNIEVNQDSQQQNTNSNSSDLFKDQTMKFTINNLSGAATGNSQATQGINSFSSTLNNVSKTGTNSILERSIVDQVNNQISDGLKNSGSSKISMVLNPESLGKVNLQIISSEKEGLSAQLVAENKDVKAALTKNIDNLKQNLQEQGINVNSITVKVQETQSGNNTQFDFQQQQNQNNFKFGHYDQNSNNNGQQNYQNNGKGAGSEIPNGKENSNDDNLKSGISQSAQYAHSGRVDYTV